MQAADRSRSKLHVLGYTCIFSLCTLIKMEDSRGQAVHWLDALAFSARQKTVHAHLAVSPIDVAPLIVSPLASTDLARGARGRARAHVLRLRRGIRIQRHRTKPARQAVVPPRNPGRVRVEEARQRSRKQAGHFVLVQHGRERVVRDQEDHGGDDEPVSAEEAGQLTQPPHFCAVLRPADLLKRLAPRRGFLIGVAGLALAAGERRVARVGAEGGGPGGEEDVQVAQTTDKKDNGDCREAGVGDGPVVEGWAVGEEAVYTSVLGQRKQREDR